MRTLAAFLGVVALAGASIAVAARSGGDDGERPPVVIVVFDALPTAMLQEPGGQIDEERFPGFGELARGSTWYRNATTVHDSTIKSIPAILDGRWPSNRRRPLIADHPENLFTLLRDRYRIFADEEGTQLCPRTVCKQKRARLLHLLHSDREARFGRALRRIRPAADGEDPGLWFMHVLLPHEPLRFLPSGRVYEGGADPEPGLDGNESFDNEFLTHQAEQRHLLQLRHTDTMLRRLLERLRRTGLYDKALLIVTADHGMSFQVKGAPAEPYRVGQIGWRRDITHANAHEVGFVPMFVKRPGQVAAAVDDGWVRTVDALPTVLGAAGVDVPDQVIGRPFGDERPRPRDLHVLTNRRGPMRLDPATMERRRKQDIEQRAARFGVGAGVKRMFRLGPNVELIGQSVRAAGRADARAAADASAAGDARAASPAGGVPTATFWGPRRFLGVDRSGRTIPSNVIGWLRGAPPAGRDLAVAVNGRIAAVGRSFKPMGSTGMNFSLMVPESAFRNGRNDVRLYEVRDGKLAAELGRP